MYLYFNKNGVLKEIINDEALRAGSANVNTIYAYFENPAIVGAWINIEFYDETTITAIMSYDGESEIPYDENRDLKYFKDYQAYPFYKYTLTSMVSGLTKASIFGSDEAVSEPIIIPANVYAQGMVVFNIEESILPSIEIDESEWNYLLAKLATMSASVDDIEQELPLKEDKANKSTTLNDANNTKYPTTLLLKTINDNLTAGINEIINNYVIGASVSGNTLTLIAKVEGQTQTITFVGSDDNAIWGNITGNITNQTDLQEALDTKVDKQTGYSLMSNDEHTKLEGIQAGAEVNVNADWNAASGDAEILNKPTIPTKTSELQNDSDFATESFVNSSVATNTAYYLGSYNLVSDLGFTVPTPRSDVADALPAYLSGLTVPITPTNNDYLFVQVPTATSTPTVIDHIDRYKYNAQYQEWIYEYTLNNSSFTQAQWDAINSGITSGDVSAFEAHIQNTTIHVTQQDKETWGAKQNAITSNNMLSSDLVNDTNKTHKFVTGAMYDYLEGILYQAPTISVFQLYYNGSAVATTLENGSSVTVNQIRHQETNIANISSLTFNGQAITPSDSAVIVNLTTPITVSATATYTMSGVNTRNASFTKGATITVNTYAYSALTSSTTAPTTGLTRQSVDSTFRNNGASFNYVSGDYLYLYTTYSGATKIQTNVLGQWADVNTTVVGNVTITKSNGVTQTYKCLRTTSAFSASGTATYRVV